MSTEVKYLLGKFLFFLKKKRKLVFFFFFLVDICLHLSIEVKYSKIVLRDLKILGKFVKKESNIICGVT